MTRHLTFDGPRAATRFTLLWTALTAGGDGKTDRTPVAIRKEARLQELLSAVSDDTGADTARALRDAPDGAPAVVTLTQDDFDLLQQYTEKVPWNPRISRDVVDLWDFLSACPKQE